MITPIALLALLPLIASAAPLRRASGVQISHNGDSSQCLTVTDSTVVDGSAVTSAPCGGNGAQGWDISSGDQLSLKLTGTNFCLDAGTGPHNNVLMKVWTCYPGLSQQHWYYTDDDRIAITGGNQCLDLGPLGPQTYQCTTGNTNQIWTTSSGGGGGGGTTTTTSAPPTTTTTTPPASNFHNVYNCNNQGQVAMTFDDGPYLYEQQVANQMNGGKATFFLNGNNYACIYDKAEAIQAIFQQGHTIGSHTWSHADLTTLDAAGINSELSQLETAFIKILGVKPKYFRPPYGSTNSFVEGILAQRGYTRSILWSDDSGDSTGSTVAQSEGVYNSVAASYPSPHLVLNHSPLTTTVNDVQPYAVNLLQGVGYQLVAVDTCLGSDGEWPYYYYGPLGTRDSTWHC